MTSLIRDIRLLIKSPRDYLYSFSYPGNKKVIIKPFDPGVTRVVQKITADLKILCPGLRVHFIGSSGLKIAGANDIDLYLSCSLTEFSFYLKKLQGYFGPCKKFRGNIVEWEIVISGFPVDVVLIDLHNRRLRNQLALYNLLKTDRKLKQQYVKLKLGLNGASQREYIRSRMDFFNRIKIPS